MTRAKKEVGWWRLGVNRWVKHRTFPRRPLLLCKNTALFVVLTIGKMSSQQIEHRNTSHSQNSVKKKQTKKTLKIRAGWIVLLTFSASCWASSLSSWIFFCLSMATSGFPWACASRSLAACSLRLTLWYARLALSSCGQTKTLLIICSRDWCVCLLYLTPKPLPFIENQLHILLFFET